MKIKLYLIVFMFFLFKADLAYCQAYQAQSPPESAQQAVEVEDKSRITLDVKGMDVVDVLQLLAKRAGMNLVVGKDVVGRVTLFLKNVKVEDAFEIILLSNNLASEKEGDIINVMSQQAYELRYGSKYHDKNKVRVIPLKNAKAQDIAVALNQLKSNNGRIVVDVGSNTVALIDNSERLKEMEEFVKNIDLPLQTRVFSLDYAPVEKLSEKIQTVLTKNIGYLQKDERTNKIVVTDFPEKLNEISRIVYAFDEKSAQVLIDAQIVEINPKKDLFAFGVDWDYWLNKNMRFAGSLPAPSLTDTTTIPNKFSFGVAAAGAVLGSPQHHKAIIDMLRVIGETKILSSPRIMVLNNQEAKILVGTKEAYITSSVSQTGETAITSQSVNFVDVGIKLYVTPSISRDGFVTMKIRPEISSSKRTDITADGKITQIPIVTTSESETTIRVKDATTIIIAGLKKDQRAKEVKKFPILGDIPLLGFFFRNYKDEVIKTELVIFLTPRIITGEEAIAYDSLTKDEDIEKRIPSSGSSPVKTKKGKKEQGLTKPLKKLKGDATL